MAEIFANGFLTYAMSADKFMYKSIGNTQQEMIKFGKASLIWQTAFRGKPLTKKPN